MQEPQNSFSYSPEIIFSRSYQKISSLCSSPLLLCVDGGIPFQQTKSLKDALQGIYFSEHVLLGGEECKTRETKQALEDWALSMNMGADTNVIGVGGGATLDLVAFFSATYARGLSLISVPSTLLAMADASFGGKCGVNAKGIKNVVGTMYHPRAILINVEFLQSLPSHQIASGLAEIAKHALLDSKYFVKEFFSSWDACLNGDLPCLEKVIAHSVAVKARFCSMGKEYRHFLNLGHTVAHALEGLEGPKLSHGVAVAIGLLVEAMVGLKRGVVSQEVVDVTRKIAACVLPSRPLAGGWDLDAWKRILVLDKKNVLGQPHVVWIRTIGELYTLNGSAAIPLEMAEVEYAYGLLSSFF